MFLFAWNACQDVEIWIFFCFFVFGVERHNNFCNLFFCLIIRLSRKWSSLLYICIMIYSSILFIDLRNLVRASLLLYKKYEPIIPVSYSIISEIVDQMIKGIDFLLRKSYYLCHKCLWNFLFIAFPFILVNIGFE